MNDIGFTDNLYIIFSVLGTIGILVSVLWFIILELQARRTRRMQIASRSLLSTSPEATARKRRWVRSTAEETRSMSDRGVDQNATIGTRQLRAF